MFSALKTLSTSSVSTEENFFCAFKDLAVVVGVLAGGRRWPVGCSEVARFSASGEQLAAEPRLLVTLCCRHATEQFELHTTQQVMLHSIASLQSSLRAGLSSATKWREAASATEAVPSAVRRSAGAGAAALSSE